MVREIATGCVDFPNSCQLFIKKRIKLLGS